MLVRDLLVLALAYSKVSLAPHSLSGVLGTSTFVHPFVQSFVLAHLPCLSAVTEDVLLVSRWRNLFFLPVTSFIALAVDYLPPGYVPFTHNCPTATEPAVTFL